MFSSIPMFPATLYLLIIPIWKQYLPLSILPYSQLLTRHLYLDAIKISLHQHIQSLHFLFLNTVSPLCLFLSWCLVPACTQLASLIPGKHLPHLCLIFLSPSDHSVPSILVCILILNSLLPLCFLYLNNLKTLHHWFHLLLMLVNRNPCLSLAFVQGILYTAVGVTYGRHLLGIIISISTWCSAKTNLLCL